MASRKKKEWDPNKSDSEDETYGAPSRKKKATSKRPAKKEPARKRPTKRRKKNRGSSSEIDDDLSINLEPWSRQQSSEIETTARTRTGRPARRTTQSQPKYEEPDSGVEYDEEQSESPEEEEQVENSEEKQVENSEEKEVENSKEKEVANSEEKEVENSEEEGTIRPTQGGKQLPNPDPSMIIKLGVSPGNLKPFKGRSTSRDIQPTGRVTRKSSRISEDREQPLMELTASGRHAQVSRQGSASAGPASPTPFTSRRTGTTARTRATAMPTIEASQEPSSRSRVEDDDDDNHSPGNFQDEEQNIVKVESDKDEGSEMSDDHPISEAGGDTVVTDVDENDEAEGQVTRRRRSLQPTTAPAATKSPPKSQNPSPSKKKRKADESDYEPEGNPEDPDDDDSSNSNASDSPRKRHKSGHTSAEDDIAEDVAELGAMGRKRKRGEVIYEEQKKLRSRGQKVDYRILRPELMNQMDEDEAGTVPTTSARGKKGDGARSLFSNYDPFAGTRIGNVSNAVDSDSSDEEDTQWSQFRNNTLGLTPTGPSGGGLFPSMNPNLTQSGFPANYGKGKVKKQTVPAGDINPVVFDKSVTFESVGGLDDYINKLTEMVILPMKYPEVYARFHMTPPRGVLFHGPPGTGKTLLGRALAASLSSEGQDVKFYMRKGSDVMSKYVGEAERSLRMLFEEATKNQPSIIFFDEFDGLAPLRTSKSEQHHASIVTTLLALMDGIDSRGQVIIIAATNRPDQIDPAFRRPGRFDREFLFGPPNEDARRSILDIHTRQWPSMKPEVKDTLAKITPGYTGADLKALCNESALNAIQGTFPQIWQSKEKLVLDPNQIKVLQKDFLAALDKIIPSAERSLPGNATPLDPSIEPLLRDPFAKAVGVVEKAMPRKSNMTELQLAERASRTESGGDLEQERIMQQLNSHRVFRPRLLIYGDYGMGQDYLGAAVLHKLDGCFIQSLDISVLFESSSDITRTVSQLVREACKRKPSILYIPKIDLWYETVGPSIVKMLAAMLQSIPATDPVMVIGLMELEPADKLANHEVVKDLFGFSKNTHISLDRISKAQRREFFAHLISMVQSSPSSFPDRPVQTRPDLPRLETAPAPEQNTEQIKERTKRQRKEDRFTLHKLVMRITPIAEYTTKNEYRALKQPVIDQNQIKYLFDEQNAQLQTDVPDQLHEGQNRPFEIDKDHKGIPGLREVATGKFYYNLDTTTIYMRVSNGYYKRPKDFLRDVKTIAKDAKTLGDKKRTLLANKLVNYVEMDMELFAREDPLFLQECDQVYERERTRAAESQQKKGDKQTTSQLNIPPHVSGPTTESSGPIVLGEPIPSDPPVPAVPADPAEAQASVLTSSHQSNGLAASTSHDNITSNTSTDPLQRDHYHIAGGTETGHQGQADQQSQAPTSALTPHTPHAQRYPVTAMAQNSLLGDYHNSASTTSSDKKTSEQRSSGPLGNSQSTNGVARGDLPDFSTIQAPTGGSQLPDTQEPSVESQHSSQPSQPMAPPAVARQATGVGNVSNDATGPHLIIDRERLQALHDELVVRTSGCTLEQLEQIQAALIDAVWRKGNEWNRQIVMHEVQNTFNATISDIEEMQGILPNSQDQDDPAA